MSWSRPKPLSRSARFGQVRRGAAGRFQFETKNRPHPRVVQGLAYTDDYRP